MAVELPESATATVLHRGSYADMGASYAAAAGWIQQHGHTVTGPALETYLNSPAEVDDADLLTEIHFPIDAEEAN